MHPFRPLLAVALTLVALSSSACAMLSRSADFWDRPNQSATDTGTERDPAPEDPQVGAIDSPERYEARAKSAWLAIEQQMRVFPGLYADYEGAPRMVAEVWPMGQAFAGAIDLAALSGDYRRVDEFTRALSHFRWGNAYSNVIKPRNNPEAHLYWDDNEWLGLDFLQAYAQTGNSHYRDLAAELFPFLKRGLHPDGGLYWEEGNPHMSRNTCSNAPGAQYALRLFLATHDPQYLDFARNLARFTNAHLCSPEGLYWDHLNDDGHLDKAVYAYNQGTPVGADLLFYRVTKDPLFLDHATRTAQAALDYFGAEDRLWKSPPCFNAIMLRNFLALDTVAPNPRYRQVTADYLARVWREARDPKTGLFGQGGIATYGPAGTTKLLDQGALVQLYALMAWPQHKLGDIH
jgi:hypothetical protein